MGWSEEVGETARLVGQLRARAEVGEGWLDGDTGSSGREEEGEMRC